jgi:hypothetical protein
LIKEVNMIPPIEMIVEPVTSEEIAEARGIPT